MGFTRWILLFSAAVLSAALLAACSSVDFAAEETKFNTRIAENNLKHFEVSITKKQVDPLRQANQDPRNRSRRMTEYSPKQLEKTLRQAADYHIKKTQYCRQGYWIIETNRFTPTMTLRGECNEPANEQDRKNFPDSIELW